MSEKIFTAENAEVADLNRLTDSVIGSAIEIHRALGPGLLESTYEMCLCRELSHRQIPFERQKAIPVVYKGMTLDCGYRADLIIDRRFLVEIKSIEAVAGIHEAQLLSYLKLGRWKSRATHKLQRPTFEVRNPEASLESRRSNQLMNSASSALSAVNC
jgi:GxxExxY protein